MKPVAFRYERPESVEEALALLGEHGPEAKVLAGGQSLVPALNMRLVRPAVVVDVNRVFRILLVVAPLLVAAITFKWCHDLSRADAERDEA